MTEQKPNGNAAAEGSEREFSIQKIYTKDLSFETPNSPEVFRMQWQPEVNLQLSNQAKKLDDANHEIVLSLTVTAKLQDKTAYLVEVQQAGIFSIKGYSEQEMGAMVGAFCPNVLFPYAREVISDLVAKGGFPQLVLAPVNFDALYQQHVQQAAQASAEQDTATTH
jgi:preprotein translocase subunit SecB